MPMNSAKAGMLSLLVPCTALSLLGTSTPARAQAPSEPPGRDLGEIGNKLANPLANIWALSFSVNAPQFFDGDLNTGDDEVGGSLLFQPVLPIPLFGEGENRTGTSTVQRNRRPLSEGEGRPACGRE